VTSVGDVDGGPEDEVLTREPGEDEVRYWRLVVREGVLVGAVFLGDWAEGSAIVDGVAAGADVSALLPALRAGDLSPFEEAAALPAA
jgi:NAD(P)H-nitrite reductase large subunit